MTAAPRFRTTTALIFMALFAACSPSGSSDAPATKPQPPVPDQNPQPVRQEETCEALVGLPKGALVSADDAVRRGRAFMVRSFATFMGATAPNQARHYAGVKGEFHPAMDALNASSLTFNVLCSDGPKRTQPTSVVVTKITPRPEVRLFNTNEFQTFQALAPEAIWGDGTLDGSLVPSVEWFSGIGWRVTLSASRQSYRPDIFAFKRALDRTVFGGKGTFETYEGTTRDTFVIVYSIDGVVNGKAIKVRNEIEYAAL